MEIALVYREIQQLLIKDENVILPKVGKFAIVAKSATFLEDCKTILPPKKELLFSASSEQGENDVLSHGSRIWLRKFAENCSRMGHLRCQDLEFSGRQKVERSLLRSQRSLILLPTVSPLRQYPLN
jgi:hypothetical protein